MTSTANLSPVEAVETPVDQAIVDTLHKYHVKRLRPDETVLATLRGGSIDKVRPGAIFGRLGPVGRAMERSLAEGEIERRQQQVDLYLHRRGLEQIEFAPTKIGYTLALTERRVLVFDYGAREFLGESTIANMALERLAHPGGCETLFFCEGRVAAVIAAWEAGDVVDHFVSRYSRAQVGLIR